MGKGDKDRTKDLNAYWNSPLWNNLKSKTLEKPCIEDNKIEHVKMETNQYNPTRFLLLDDIREPANCFLYDEDRSLQQFSGIANFKWDIVRSYDEFVDYIEKFGIPNVVSFDNDLIDCQDPDISVEELTELYSMMNWKNSRFKTGAHCAEWLVERCKELQHPLPKYYVHSANSAARPIIKAIFETARPFIKH